MDGIVAARPAGTRHPARMKAGRAHRSERPDPSRFLTLDLLSATKGAVTNPAEFDFHGSGARRHLRRLPASARDCPVGRSSKYGGFTFLTKLDDIFAAEQKPEVFAVAPSMLLPAFGTDEPMIPIDIDPPEPRLPPDPAAAVHAACSTS